MREYKNDWLAVLLDAILLYLRSCLQSEIILYLRHSHRSGNPFGTRIGFQIILKYEIHFHIFTSIAREQLKHQCDNIAKFDNAVFNDLTENSLIGKPSELSVLIVRNRKTMLANASRSNVPNVLYAKYMNIVLTSAPQKVCLMILCKLMMLIFEN